MMLIFSNIFSLLVMESGRQSSKLSQQSPPWRRNLCPRAASANSAFRVSTSQLVTSGGNLLTAVRTRSAAAWSG